MKCVRLFCRLFVFVVLFFPLPLFAQVVDMLRVTPVRIDIQAPVSGASLTLSNGGSRPMAVQVRVFKWHQKNGEDIYTLAKGVAVSPPMLSLRPKSESVLRVVRTNAAPLVQEESYRLVVDQLPDPALRRQKGSTISFVVRHNIPVFFAPQGMLEPDLTWKAVPVKGGYRVTASNNGTRHIGLAEVKLLSGKTVVGTLNGLAGYALAGSSGSFFVSGRSGKMPDRIEAVDTNRTPVNDIIR